ISRVGKGKYAFSTKFNLNDLSAKHYPKRKAGSRTTALPRIVGNSLGAFKEDEEINTNNVYSLVKETLENDEDFKHLTPEKKRSRISAQLAFLANKGKLVRVAPGKFNLPS